MLNSSLPNIKWSFWLFVDKNWSIISSTTNNFLVWSDLNIDKKYFELKNWDSLSDIIVLNWEYYMIWVSVSSWYREYKTTWDYINDVYSFIFSPLWKEIDESNKLKTIKQKIIHPKHSSKENLEIWTFFLNWNLYWIESNSIIEAVDPEIVEIPWNNKVAWSIRYNYNWDDKVIYVIDINKILSKNPTENKDFNNKNVVILKVKNILFWILVDELEWVNVYDKKNLQDTQKNFLWNQTLWYVKYLAKTEEWSSSSMFSIIDPKIILDIISKK